MSFPESAPLRTFDSAHPATRTTAGQATRGEIEAAACELIVRFECDYFGRGPKQIRAHLIGDLLLIRMSGVLTLAETQLINAQPATPLVKELRSQLIHSAHAALQSLVENLTGVPVNEILFDIGLETDEEFILFSLRERPVLRESVRR